MRHWHILIVDDSPAMRAFIRRVIQLCAFGEYEFSEAANGREALASIAERCPDVVLTDVNMPVMNGEEFLICLAADMPDRKPPVVVVSTDSTHTRVDSMLRLGAVSYLRKPFTPEAMQQVLDETRLLPGGVVRS